MTGAIVIWQSLGASAAAATRTRIFHHKEITIKANDKPAQARCDSCRYWRTLEAQATPDPIPGHCHRYPPAQVVAGHEGLSARRDANAWAFPVVYSTSWCGEQQHREGGLAPASGSGAAG